MLMGHTGLEPDDVSTESTNNLPNQASRNLAQSGAVGALSGAVGPDLQQIIDAWPRLSETDKTALLAIVQSAKPQ